MLHDFSTIFPESDLSKDFAESFTLLDSIFGFLNCPHAIHKDCNHNLQFWHECERNIAKLKELWIELIGESAITPYFHVTEFHIGGMIARSPYGSIAPFALQSQELKHQIQTRIQFRKTNQGAIQKPKIKLTSKRSSKTVGKQKYVRKIPLGVKECRSTSAFELFVKSHNSSNSHSTTRLPTLKPPKTLPCQSSNPTPNKQSSVKPSSAFDLFLGQQNSKKSNSTSQAIIGLEHAQLWMTCNPQLCAMPHQTPVRLDSDICKALKLREIFYK